MLVFITHPRYFPLQKLPKKGVDLIFLFNSTYLYRRLSSKYKVLELSPEGKLIRHNLKIPANTPTPTEEKLLIDQLLGTLAYFYNKLEGGNRKLKIRSKRGKRKKNPVAEMMKLPNQTVKRLEGIKNKILFLEQELFQTAGELIYAQTLLPIFDRGREELLFNILVRIGNTFFASYLSLNGFHPLNHSPILAVYRWNWIVKIASFYRWNKWDIYQSPSGELSFHYNYLKTICRLFIEELHKVPLSQPIAEYRKRVKELKNRTPNRIYF